MEEIIRLLTDNPILLILLVTWILSALAGVFTRAARKAEQQRRQAQQEQRKREQRTTTARPRAEPPAQQQPTVQRWPEQEQRWPEQQRPAQRRPVRPKPAPAPRQARTGAPRPMTPEEAAAQIRRLMGMEPEPQPARREPEPPQPVAEPVRQRRTISKPFGGLGSAGRRQLEIHVDSHVGEKMHDRRMATRRSSLAPDRPVPSSGPAAPRRRPYELSELRNLPKAFVLREILGPPKAMQNEWQP